MLQKKAIAILLPSLLGGLVHATESPTTPQVVGFRPVYSNTTGADSVSGKLEAGATLRVDPAKLHYQDADGDLEDPAAVRFSWLLDGVELAKSASVQLPASQDVVGKKLTLQVTPAALTGLPREGKPLALSDLRVAGATGGDVDGNITAAEDQTLVNRVTGYVKLSEDTQAGMTMTADVTVQNSGGIADRDLSYRYQWSRGTTLQGQPKTLNSKSDSYSVTKADVGHVLNIEVKPVYKGKLGNPWTDHSYQIDYAYLEVGGTLSISGRPQVGETLRATDNLYVVDPSTMDTRKSWTLYWERENSRGGWDTISGAYGKDNYTVRSGDIGTRIRVFAQTIQWSRRLSESAPIRVEYITPTFDGRVSISGSALVGSTLQADNRLTVRNIETMGSVTWSYQWQRGNGGTWSDIPGATGSYRVASEDSNKQLRIVAKPSRGSWQYSNQVTVQQAMINGYQVIRAGGKEFAYLGEKTEGEVGGTCSAAGFYGGAPNSTELGMLYDAHPGNYGWPLSGLYRSSTRTHEGVIMVFSMRDFMFTGAADIAKHHVACIR